MSDPQKQTIQSSEPSPCTDDNRVALLGIVVKNEDSTVQLNAILHEYRSYVTGRMGVPCPPKDLAIITVVLDAPTDVVSALAGKIGMLKGVSSKTVYLKLDD